MILFLLLFFQADEVTTFRGTGAVRPLSKSKITVSSDGEVYLVNQNCQIIHFGSDGARLNQLSGKGEGPGELLSPRALGIQGDEVWVYDYMKGAILWFDKKGEYLRQVKSEALGARIAKTAHGWATLKVSHGREGPAMALLYDENLEKVTKLFDWKSIWISPAKLYKRPASDMAVNPAVENHFWAVDPKTDRLFLTHTGPVFKITAIDLNKQEVKHFIRHEIRPVDFNKSWGRARIRNGNETPGRKSFTAVLDAPEYFPLIRSLSLSPQGYIVVELWTNEPDEVQSYLVMDQKGRRVALNFKPEHNHRVLAIVGEAAFLTGYDNELGEAVIYRCLKSQIDAVAQSRPIEYEHQMGVFARLK